jgi:co-chaperonin GroES (HSP10)
MAKKAAPKTVEPVFGKKAGQIAGVTPVGFCILVEELTTQDIINSKLILTGESKEECPQAYILAIGPKVDMTYGFKVGDRVMLQGTNNPVPQFTGERKLAIIEPHTIRAVITESPFIEEVLSEVLSEVPSE